MKSGNTHSLTSILLMNKIENQNNDRNRRNSKHFVCLGKLFILRYLALKDKVTVVFW